MDTTPQQRIEADLKTALKARDSERVSTLRLVLTELKNEKIRRRDEVDEAGFLSILRKGVKQRNEAAEQFRNGGREEMAEKEKREAVILQEYLPAAVSDDDLRAAIEDLVESQGLSGMKDMGKVIPPTIARFEGRADGAAVSRIAREVLSSGS